MALVPPFLLVVVSALVKCSNGNMESLSPLTVADPLHGLTVHTAPKTQPIDEEILKLVEMLKPMQIFNRSLHSNSLNLSSCVVSIGKIMGDLVEHKSLYTLQILDSWAKFESGVLKGNLDWMGRYHECIGASMPQLNITTQYCSTHFGKSPVKGQLGMAGLTLANCFPKDCSAANISNLFETVVDELGVDIKTTVGCPEQFEKWEFKDVLGVLVLLLFVFIVLGATLYEYFTSIMESQHTDDTEVLYADALNGHAPQFKAATEHGMVHKLILAFSAIENTKRLLSTEQRPGDIHCLHGMRFLSMSWVILGHSFLFVAYYANNLFYPASYLVHHGEFQAIVNGTFSVDSFFYISGLLAAYLGLRQLGKSDGKMNVPLMYLLRYIRLTPAYAFCMLMSISIWPKFGEGPLWPVIVRPLVENCQKYWWSSLLYINNLYPSDMVSECYAWGWYLANDTQFYLLLPIFLAMLYKFPIAGIICSVIVMIESITVTGVFSSITKQQPQIVGIGQLAGAVLNPQHITVGANNNTDPVYSIYMSDLYTKPWCRIGAYMVGILTGYILHTYKGKIRMSKAVAFLGWACAAAINCSIVYGLYPTVSHGSTLTVNTAAFYNAVARPMWCVGLAWVTVACVSGYGGPIDTFLSWKGFIPLSRLTYCCYLLHPLIIWWFFGTQEIMVHYSISYVLSIFLGSLVLAHLFGYAVHLLVEAPVIIITKTITGKLTETPVATATTNTRHLQFYTNEADGEQHSTA